MEVQELIFAVHPGMTDHLRTIVFIHSKLLYCPEVLLQEEKLHILKLFFRPYLDLQLSS